MPGSEPRRGDADKRLFFYGTLMDADVQARVLGRTLTPDYLTLAILRHFRSVYIAGQVYPMLLPHRGGAVEGLVATGLNRDDLTRIANYEGDDYRCERHQIVIDDGKSTLSAWLYRGQAQLRPSNRPWRLAAWQAKNKTMYLRAFDAALRGVAGNRQG